MQRYRLILSKTNRGVLDTSVYKRTHYVIHALLHQYLRLLPRPVMALESSAGRVSTDGVVYNN